jgi:putative endonuclease
MPSKFPPHIRLGKKGENIAISFLEAKGFRILACNFRFKKAEVDIIAKRDQRLSFVEVKTRTGKGFTRAENSINKTKQHLYFLAAQEYCKKEAISCRIQFDVIVIELFAYGKDLFYFPDSFYPNPENTLKDK